MGVLDDLRQAAAEAPDVEFYPGSKVPIVRHPNRAEKDTYVAPPEDAWDQDPATRRRQSIRGEEREFFTLGALAAALNRRPVTLRTWERNKVIPGPLFVKKGDNPNGRRRLYSRAQIEGLIKIAEEEGILRPDAKGFYKPITQTNFTKRAFALFKEIYEQETS